jgi:hypothetical protein
MMLAVAVIVLPAFALNPVGVPAACEIGQALAISATAIAALVRFTGLNMLQRLPRPPIAHAWLTGTFTGSHRPQSNWRSCCD